MFLLHVDPNKMTSTKSPTVMKTIYDLVLFHPSCMEENIMMVHPHLQTF